MASSNQDIEMPDPDSDTQMTSPDASTGLATAAVEPSAAATSSPPQSALITPDTQSATGPSNTDPAPPTQSSDPTLFKEYWPWDVEPVDPTNVQLMNGQSCVINYDDDLYFQAWKATDAAMTANCDALLILTKDRKDDAYPHMDTFRTEHWFRLSEHEDGIEAVSVKKGKPQRLWAIGFVE